MDRRDFFKRIASGVVAGVAVGAASPNKFNHIEYGYVFIGTKKVGLDGEGNWNDYEWKIKPLHDGTRAIVLEKK